MKHFVDGDQLCVTRDDFEDLQTSAAVFLDLDSEDAQTIINKGITALPFGRLRGLNAELRQQEQQMLNAAIERMEAPDGN